VKKGRHGEQGFGLRLLRGGGEPPKCGGDRGAGGGVAVPQGGVARRQDASEGRLERWVGREVTRGRERAEGG
jgi:hypothetical protein